MSDALSLAGSLCQTPKRPTALPDVPQRSQTWPQTAGPGSSMTASGPRAGGMQYETLKVCRVEGRDLKDSLEPVLSLDGSG